MKLLSIMIAKSVRKIWVRIFVKVATKCRVVNVRCLLGKSVRKIKAKETKLPKIACELVRIFGF